MWVILGVRDERCEHFESEILLVFDAVSPSLNDPDLVVEAFHEAERDFVVGMAIADNAVPVSLDHGGEFFKRLQALPTQLRSPIAKEFFGPDGLVVIPKLVETFFQQIRLMQPPVGVQ